MKKNQNLRSIEGSASIAKWILGPKKSRILLAASLTQIIFSALDTIFLLLVGSLALSFTNSKNDLRLPGITAEIGVSQNSLFLLVAAVIIIKNIGSLMIQGWVLKSLASREAEISTSLIRASIFEKLESVKLSDSSALLQAIAVLVGKLFDSLLLPLITLVAEVTTLIAVVIGLLLFDPQISLITIGYMSVTGIFFAKLLAKHQQAVGAEAVILGKESLKIFNAIKNLNQELRLAHREIPALNSFFLVRSKLAKVQAYSKFMRSLPRYMLELVVVFGFGLMVVIIHGSHLDSKIASLAVFVAAGYRLLPSLNSIIMINGSIRNGVPLLREIDMLGRRFNIRNMDLAYESGQSSRKQVRVDGDIYFQQVTYGYPESNKIIIKDLSYKIHQNETIWISGPSGAGKSTFIQLAAGILTPSTGKIFFSKDGRETKVDQESYGISFLSQSSPLLDASFAYNIALRETTKDDISRLISSAEKAGILERILAENGTFDALIGENGGRLSAGERQRLGLARSLFDNPTLLILDEPTANLDALSEKIVWDSMRLLKGSTTILLVSHRPVPSGVFDHALELTVTHDG